VAACRIWLEAWNDVLRLLDKAGIKSIEEFDERFRGTQSLFNWIQDLESELWDAGDPCWGWGWIGWSDCYRFTRTERVDLNRCEQIPREGFAIADLRDRADIADRLADVCEEQGRDEEAKEFRRQSERRATAVEVSRTTSSTGKVLAKRPRSTSAARGCPSASYRTWPACCARRRACP
jgi:hypothetical protein